MYVSNTSDHELTVTATADATDDQEKIDETKTIKCKINTQVNKITADKQKVSSDVKGLVTSTGMLRNWSSDAEKYYGYSESAFNSDIENYNIVEYRSQITTEGNQPYYLSVKDTPDNNGVVIGAYASGVVTGKMTEQNGVYTAADYSKKYANNTNTQYVYVLVKYPKVDTKETRVTNSITAYATGIDDNKEVASNAAVADDTISSDAIYDGDIWGIKKNGIAENENTGKTILDNGGDKEISFWINPATAHTYKYGVKDNGSFKDNNNGPYKIDVTDDVMYLSSGENGITKRLSDGDYEFNKIVVYIKDSKIEDGFDSSGLPKMKLITRSSKLAPLTIYYKTSVQGAWQKLEVKSYNYSKEFNSPYYKSSELELPENTVQVKISYGNSEKGSFGDTYIRAQIFGTLKHDGPNVKTILENDNNVHELKLINWASIQGFDKDGKWLNVASEKNIKNSLNTSAIKDDLLKFDEENYEGHSVAEDKQSQRATAISTLKEVKLYAGASNGVNVTASGTDALSINYSLVAILSGNARQRSDAEALAECNGIYGSKKAVFYDLLPAGVEYSGVTSTQQFAINDADINTSNTGGIYKQQGNVNWGFPKPNTDNFGYYETDKTNLINYTSKPTVSVETIDNYKNTGRQMVKLTLDYSDVPIGYIGSSYRIYSNVYGVTLRTKAYTSRLAASQMNEIHENQFAAQFYDDNGKLCDLENYTNSRKNDGTYYGGDAAAFDQLGGGSQSDKTVVYAKSSFSYLPTATYTGIELSIKADDYDKVFKKDTKTLCGKNYTYRLSFIQNNKDPNAKSSDLVLFNTIENDYGSNEHWFGTLKGFDVTEANEKIRKTYPNYEGIKVYVNEKVISDSDYQQSGKVTAQTLRDNADGWHIYNEGDDLSKVKSIAFYVGDDIEFKDDLCLLNIYMKMKAPNTIPSSSLKAYSNMAYYCETSNGKSTNTGNQTTKTLTCKTVNVFPTIEKSFKGIVDPNNKQFKFTIKPIRYEGNENITADNMPVPNETTITVDSENNWSKKFGNITYYKEGTYYYQIYENDLSNDSSYSGFNFDQKTYNVKVEVYNSSYTSAILNAKLYLEEQQPDGTLSYIEKSTSPVINFTNNYSPLSTRLSLPAVVKNVNGDKMTSDKTFTFKIKGENAFTPMPSNDTVTITVNDNKENTAQFGDIYYSAPGEYNYTISEIADNDDGYTYDSSVYDLRVLVFDNNGRLTAITTITKNGNNVNENKFRFTNTYKTTSSVEYEFPQIVKTIKGNADSNDKKTFTFELKSNDVNAPMPANSTISVNGEGTAKFDKITFTKAGTYTYTISEVNTGETNYTYDNSVYTITVTVTDENSALKANSVITKNGENTDNIEFVNEYTKTDESSIPDSSSSDSSSDSESSSVPDSSSNSDSSSVPDSSSNSDNSSVPDSSSNSDSSSVPDSSSNSDSSSNIDSSTSDSSKNSGVEDNSGSGNNSSSSSSNNGEGSDDDDSSENSKPDNSNGGSDDNSHNTDENNGNGDNPNTGSAAVSGLFLTAVLAGLCIGWRKKSDNNKDDND